MNISDIIGFVFIAIGLLCILPTVYLSPIFLIVSGAFIAAGIVLIITAGNMCRASEDVQTSENSVYAVLKIPSKSTKAASAPPLTKIPA